MHKHYLKSLLFVAPLLLTQLGHAGDEYLEVSELEQMDLDSVENEMPAKGLEFSSANPLTPFALKKNGKVRKHFKIPYRTLVEYYNYAAPGVIFENPEQSPLLDMDLKEMSDRQAKDIKWYVDMRKKKAFPLELINPHSVSNLFKVDPEAYTAQTNEKDFLSAKRAIYKDTAFNEKKLRYERNLIHLEDWRSLNHPPVDDLGPDLTVWDANYAPIDYSKHEHSGFYSADFHKKIDEISGTELTFGNKIEFLANGHSFQRKLKEVRAAKKSVLIAVMSFFCDATSRQLEDLLIEKVKEGVDVKLMVEKVWTRVAMKKCMNRMIKSGVDVVYSPDFGKSKLKDNLFHNKFMILDSERVIMGGSNIVEGDNASTGFNHFNRDNDIFIQGPVVSEVQLAFTFYWKKFRGERNEENLANNPNLKPIEHYEQLALDRKAAEKAAGARGQENYGKLDDKELRNQGVCRFMTQNKYADKHLLSKVFIEHLKVANSQINMTTGSLQFAIPQDDEEEAARETWNKRFFREVFAANDRGVKLDLIGNGIDGGYGEASSMINNINLKNRFRFKPISKTIFSILTGWLDKGAAKKNIPYMDYIQKRPNSRAWQNFQYMHSKLIQIDRTMNMVSSYNLEEWSGDKSYESSVMCLDAGLSQEMDKSFVRDFVNSVPAVQ